MSPAINDNDPQTKRATTVNKHVGLRIREQRLAMGLSQRQLARAIGVTYQQEHKYERGLSRISAGYLFAIAQALATEPAWFFEGISAEHAVGEVPQRQRMQLELIRNFALIQDEAQQEAICTMARLLAGS